MSLGATLPFRVLIAWDEVVSEEIQETGEAASQLQQQERPEDGPYPAPVGDIR